MRISCLESLKMETGVMPTRKRPVNLTMNEALVAQAKAYTNNLSATMESLLADFVANQQSSQRNRTTAISISFYSLWRSERKVCPL